MVSQPPSPREISGRTALILAVASLVTGCALTGAYWLVGKLVGPGWVAALILHVPAAILVYRWQRPVLRPSWQDALPAVVIVAGAAALAAFSRVLGGGDVPPPALGWQQLAFILLIPPIEELVFRVGIGTVFRQRGGPLWGAWFSAIVFALAHTGPSLGLPLGPFLLGLACEALYIRSGRLAPAVLFHAACNATVVIFALGDARWLQWLRLLYS